MEILEKCSDQHIEISWDWSDNLVLKCPLCTMRQEQVSEGDITNSERDIINKEEEIEELEGKVEDLEERVETFERWVDNAP